MERNYNETVNQFKATDCGRFGKAFEINVKSYMNGKRGNSDHVSAKGKADVQHKKVRYEIKSNCGEINNDILKNDYIVYTYDNATMYVEPQNARVIPAAEFVKLVERLGLMRTKKSTNGQLKTTIQSYANSKRKSALWMQAVDSYPTLAEHLGRQHDRVAERQRSAVSKEPTVKKERETMDYIVTIEAICTFNINGVEEQVMHFFKGIGFTIDEAEKAARRKMAVYNTNKYVSNMEVKTIYIDW